MFPIIVLVTLWGDCLFPHPLFLLDCGLLEDVAWQRAGDQHLLVFFPYLSSLLPMAESADRLPNIYFLGFLSNRNLWASPDKKKSTKQNSNKQNYIIQLPWQIEQADEV